MLRIGFLGIAHMHAYGYAAALRARSDAEIAGVWDPSPDRAEKFAAHAAAPVMGEAEALIEASDAVIVCSQNLRHAELVGGARSAGKPTLCEKPLAASEDEAARLDSPGPLLMTAFPCPHSPAFRRLKQRLDAGDLGRVVAVCATNRGQCPFDWFVDPAESGGGAMIDHTVHVADLLYRLFGKQPERVAASVGRNVHGQDWEDTAMLTLDYAGGAFATLDSSWSRPKSYKTWGDVNLSVVGEKGTIEVALFNQAVNVYRDRHSLAGYGSDLDAMLVDDFIAAARGEREPLTTADDGLRASRVALAAYRSVVSGQPEPVA